MKSNIRLLFSYIGKHRGLFIGGVLMLLVTDIFQQARPKLIQYCIDSITKPVFNLSLAMWIIILLGNLLFENVFRFFWRMFIVGGSRKTEKDILNDYFSKLLTLDQTFYNKMPTGDLMARATNDVISVRALIGEGILIISDTVFVAGLSLVFMIKISPSMTFYSLLPLPILGFFLWYLIKKVHKCYDDVQAQFSDVTARAQENLSGIRVIKAHAMEQFETNEFDKITKSYVNKFMRLTKFEAGVEPLIRLIAGTGIVIVLFIGGKYIIEKRITIGEFTAFFIYMMTLVWPVIAIGWSATLIQRGLTSLARIKQVLDTAPKITNPCANSETYAESQILHGDLIFENISFKYSDDGPDVLKNINIRIPEGKTAGIVGPTGSGKTTLLNLIPRLYEPNHGRVLIGDKDIKTVCLDELRKQIGIVPQEPFLFSENIARNLRPELPNAALDDICDALRIAHIEEEINEFPQGAGTVVGERGLRLSGGQKQRVTLARAIARAPRIIILDDSLSSVDAHTENNILIKLKDFMKERTSIIVAHRISTVKDADIIFVIQDGVVTEQGTHEELIEQKKFYAKLYEQQKLERKIEEI